MRVRTIALVGLAGAAVAYLFDPTSGSARRRRLRDQIMALARRGTRDETASTPLPQNMVPSPKPEISAPPEGPPKEGIPLGPGALPMDDAAIAGRIRTEVFGRRGLETGRIVVDVVRGVAFLRGELKDGHAIEEIVDRTGDVPGVRGVQNLIVVRMPESVALTRPIRTLGDAGSG